MITICSLCINHFIITTCSLHNQHCVCTRSDQFGSIWIRSTLTGFALIVLDLRCLGTTLEWQSSKLRTNFVRITICSLHVHYMIIICSLHDHYLFTIYKSLYVHYIINAAFARDRSSSVPFGSGLLWLNSP